MENKVAEQLRVRFHYVKSPSFDEHPVHGVFGGATPSGDLVMSLYSERLPIPTSIVYDVAPADTAEDASKMNEVERAGRDGPVRFVHGAFYMSPAMALALRDWLTHHLKEIEEA